MGIRDLFVFLRNRGIHFERHRASHFANKTVAIDGYSLFFRLYYASKKLGYHRHIENSMILLKQFLEKWPLTTRLVFILDNPVKSGMKMATILKRRADEKAIREELKALDADTEESRMNPLIRARRETLKQRSKETFPEICRGMIDYLREQGYTMVVSEGEAERLACEMAIDGKVDYVYSNDSDCLALSCPSLIFEDTGSLLGVVRLKEVLKTLNLDEDSFTDFCILLGTDFNERIQGPEEAFSSIRTYSNIENIPTLSKEMKDILLQVRTQYRQ